MVPFANFLIPTLYSLLIRLIFCRPEPTITWKKNGRQIHWKNSTFKIPPSFHGRLLIITSASKTSHQDRYTCEAENSQNKEQPLIRSINLIVKGNQPALCYSMHVLEALLPLDI